MTSPARVPAVSLRPLRWWDLEAVVRLEREVFGPTAWSAEQFWSELAQRATRWYAVAEVDGGLAGYAGLMTTGSEADVQTLAVAPAFRRRGVGAVLLSALLAEAVSRGSSAVLLEVRADNPAAITLYRRHGFERLAVRRGYYQPEGVDAWVMRLRPVTSPPDGPGPAAEPVRSGAP